MEIKVKRQAFKKILLCMFLVIMSLTCLCGCQNTTKECFYAYFEDTAFIMVYDKNSNVLYEIMLPLEPILLWGKSAGLNSIPVAMRNFVGLKEEGFLVGTASNLQTLRDMLDVMGSDEESKASGEKRLKTFASNISVLSKKPLSDNMNKLCGQDMAKALKLLDGKEPKAVFYDAQALFNNEDLNFSQRYFTQWLEQVLGGY